MQWTAAMETKRKQMEHGRNSAAGRQSTSEKIYDKKNLH